MRNTRRNYRCTVCFYAFNDAWTASGMHRCPNCRYLMEAEKACGECDSCLKAEDKQMAMLDHVSSPFDHKDHKVITIWSNALRGFPCEKVVAAEEVMG